MIPALRTPRLVATPAGLADAPLFERLWGDVRVARTLGGVRDRAAVASALQESVEHARRHGFGRWVLRHDGEPVGALKLAVCTIAGRDEVELGYALLPEHWGKGYATEASTAALSFAADELGLRSVVAFALTTNARSFAVMERLGFVHERLIDLPAGPHDVRRRHLSRPGRVIV